jgi:hemoglobin
MQFAIGESERDQWMYCMISAMQTLKLEEKLMIKLAEQLRGVADFMRNKSE